MNKKSKFSGIRAETQRGATLVVALIILLVMTIIGVSSMKSSTLQERMAGNARQKAVSKNAALVAMRDAEKWLNTAVPNAPVTPNLSAFNGNNGLYSAVIRPGPQAAVPVAFDVADPADWSGKGVASSAVSAALVSQQPKYIIEYIGRDLRGTAQNTVTSGDAEEKFNAKYWPYIFRITAIGWGKDANITTVLESTYMTGVQ